MRVRWPDGEPPVRDVPAVQVWRVRRDAHVGIGPPVALLLHRGLLPLGRLPLRRRLGRRGRRRRRIGRWRRWVWLRRARPIAAWRSPSFSSRPLRRSRTSLGSQSPPLGRDPARSRSSRPRADSQLTAASVTPRSTQQGRHKLLVRKPNERFGLSAVDAFQTEDAVPYRDKDLRTPPKDPVPMTTWTREKRGCRRQLRETTAE